MTLFLLHTLMLAHAFELFTQLHHVTKLYTSKLNCCWSFNRKWQVRNNSFRWIIEINNAFPKTAIDKKTLLFLSRLSLERKRNDRRRDLKRFNCLRSQHLNQAKSIDWLFFLQPHFFPRTYLLWGLINGFQFSCFFANEKSMATSFAVFFRCSWMRERRHIPTIESNIFPSL